MGLELKLVHVSVIKLDAHPLVTSIKLFLKILCVYNFLFLGSGLQGRWASASGLMRSVLSLARVSGGAGNSTALGHLMQWAWVGGSRLGGCCCFLPS